MLGLRLRAILLGLALIPVNCYWVIITEERWAVLDGTCLPLFIEPLFILFLLALINLSLKKRFPHLLLRPAELILIYIMLTISCTLAGHDMLQNLFGTIAFPLWYATLNPFDYWNQFFPYLPTWLLVWDIPALQALYEGHASWYNPAYLRAWASPLLGWGVFVMCMLTTLFCVNVLLRKPWVDNEKLTFPLIQLPLAICRQESFFRNRLMWLGFGLAFALRLLAGLHRFFPELPYLKINYNENSLLMPTPPWNAIGSLPLSFYPFMIGIVYFIPLELSFSCWFFYLFRDAQIVASAAAGWNGIRDLPYTNEQSAGAWIGMGLVLVWSLRKHLVRAFQSAFLRAPKEDAREAISYRWAFIGLFLGLAGMAAFGILAGMSLPLTAVFLIAWFLIALTINRVRAEFGAPHEIFYINPVPNLVEVFGADVLGRRNLVGLSMMYWFNRCDRNHPMPTQFEAMKMSEGVGILKCLFWPVLLASLVAIISTYWAQLYQLYRDGASAKTIAFKVQVGYQSFAPLANWFEFSEPAQNPRRLAMLVGLVVVFALRALRDRFLGWPLHPAGYALGMSFALQYFWFCFLLGWLIKLSIAHFGGMHAQRKAVPFFLGLILGDYTIGALWAIYGPLMGVQTYKIFI